MRFLFLIACVFAAAPGPAGAEYRVALIIGDGDSKSVASQLEEYGFLCEITPNLSEKELGRKIESWASKTPTSSTALVYFEGGVKIHQVSGTPKACLISNNDRAIPVARVFEILGGRGGSRYNMVVAKSETTPPLEVELPENSRFSYQGVDAALKAAAVTGKGSVAISPPDKFVPGKNAGDEWVNARGMVFCWCPPGKYIAGSPEGTPGRFPDEEQREVVVKDGFWIGKYELTRSQSLRNLSRDSIGSDKNHPVERLHWDDGSRMVKVTLTGDERNAGRLPPGWQYHLPDSDQWEYAARAGTSTAYYFGDDMNSLREHANFADKSFYDSGDIFSNHAHRTLDDGFVKLAPVGSFKANPWGLHDIYGNVSEWCRDQSARGGGWVSLGENCRSAYRDHYSSRNEQNYLGYRIVIQPNVPDPNRE